MTNTHTMTTNRDVERRRTAAYWYAVGRADESGGNDHSEAFSQFAAGEAQAYYSEHRSHLESIPGQWERFIEFVRS